MQPSCLFIGIGVSGGAVPEHFLALGRELAERGHKVLILTWPPRARIENHDGNPAIWSWPSRRPTGLKDAWFLYKLTRKYRPSCFIANFAAENVMTLVGAWCSVPVRICYAHTLSDAISLDAGRIGLRERFQVLRKSYLLKLASHLVANSEASSADSQRLFSIPRRKCKVLHLSLADPIDVGDANPVSDETHLLCVGRLAGCKGQDVLLRAAAKLKGGGVSFRLTLIGDGPLKGQLADLASTLGVADRCSFLGALSHREVLERVARATVMVVPSRSEAFGLVCIESLALGVPVVASRVGGIPEIIRDGVEGFLVSPGAADPMAEKLGMLLSSSSLRQSFRQNARARFLSDFERKRVIPRQADWFEKILTRQGLRPARRVSLLTS